MLDCAFGTADGLDLPVQTSQDQEIKNVTYNGWLHEHFVIPSAKSLHKYTC